MEGKLIRESINDEYEWLQYNSELRIIHSIKDDMFQAQSILNALGSKKQFRKWVENKQTKELLQGFNEYFANGNFLPLEKNVNTNETKIIDYRNKLPIEMRGIYIHRLLVNSVAMWAAPQYAIKIYKLLDYLYESERTMLQDQIEEKDAQIQTKVTQIECLKPRTVPEGKEKNYIYCIYTNKTDDVDVVKLNFVRRNKKRIKVALKDVDPEQIIFYRECLPIAMSINEIIKSKICFFLRKDDYRFEKHSGAMYVNADYLDEIREMFEEYFVEILDS